MTMTPLTPLDRTSPSFKTDLNDFFADELPNFVTEANALQTDVTAKQATASTAATNAAASETAANSAAAAANTSKLAAATSEAAAAASATLAQNQGASVTATSTTSVAIGTGAKAFTVQTGKQFAAGQFIQATNSADSTAYMHGQVTSYNSATGALVIDSQATNGTGTVASWNISLSGARGTAGTLAGSATGAINELKGANIASAATVNLDTATGNLVHITGTTTITSITLASGAERTVVFDGALTLTHNATTLILPGAANITTAAGDCMKVRGDGSGNVRVVSYTKASGASVVASPAGWTLLGSPISASNSATVDVEGLFDSTYDMYAIVISDLAPDGSASLQAQMKLGGSYRSAHYGYQAAANNGSAGYQSFNSAAAFGNAVIQITGGLSSGVNSNTELIIYVPASSFNASRTPMIFWSGMYSAGSTFYVYNGGGVNQAGYGSLSGLRFLLNTGNIARGTFRLYGIRKS